jgi:hypothetical protein
MGIFLSRSCTRIPIARLGSSIGELLSTVGRLHGLGAGVAIVDGDLAGEYAPEGDGKLFFTMAATLCRLV